MSPTLKSTGGWVTWGQTLGVFPLEQTRHVGVAKSEHPRLTNDEIILEEFRPICDHNSPTSQTARQTDGQTDRQTTWDRNTTLCTKVHRAVKIVIVLHCGNCRSIDQVNPLKQQWINDCWHYHDCYRQWLLNQKHIVIVHAIDFHPKINIRPVYPNFSTSMSSSMTVENNTICTVLQGSLATRLRWVSEWVRVPTSGAMCHRVSEQKRLK